MERFVKSGLLVLFAFLFVSCNQLNEVIEPQRSKSAGEFSSQVQPILDRSCGSSSCHGGGAQGFGGGLDLTSYEGLMRGSKYGAVVISGSPFMSHLVQSINPSDTTLSPVSSVQMPAGRNTLPQSDIQTIVNWIRNGARNDEGELPFAQVSTAGKVFFSSQSVDLVGVIDRSTNLITRYISVGFPLPLTTPPEAPHNVQIDDQGRYYYVTLIRSAKLKKYNAATNQLLGEVVVGTSTAHVVLSLDGSKAYVTNFDQSAGRVYVVNTGTMTISKIISSTTFMKGTHGARLSHDGKYLYIGSNGLDLINIINTDRDSLAASVGVSPLVPPFGSFRYKPYQIAVRSDDRFIYATLQGTGQVAVIERDTAANTFTWRDSILVGTTPLQCEVTRDRRFLYVCNRGSNNVSVIDAQTNRFLTNIASVGQQPHGIDISDDSRTAYITCENVQAAEPPHHAVSGSTVPGFLTVIDVGTQSVIKRIEIGGFGAGVSVYPGKGN
jgi:YVTN family beta-propeller protein